MSPNARTMLRQSIEMFLGAVRGEWGARSWGNFARYLLWQVRHLVTELRA
jgi:hypothetical protein